MDKNEFLGLKSIVFLLLFGQIGYGNEKIDKRWNEVEQLSDRAYDLVYVDLDSAETLINKALSIINEPYDSLIYASYLSTTACVLFENGEFEEALSNNFKSLQIRERIGAYEQVPTSLLNIANVYYYTDAYDKSIDYLRKAIEVKNNLSSPKREYCSIYNTMGLSFWNLGKEDSTEYYFKEGIEILKLDSNQSDLIADLYGNLGSLYFDRLEFEIAEDYYLKALKVYNKLSVYNGSVWALMKLGQLYLKQERFKEAIESLRHAKKLSAKSASLPAKNELNYFLFSYFMLTNNIDSADFYINKYTSLQDSITTLKTEENIQKMEAKYQLAKQREALALSKENEANLEAENETQKTILTASIGGLAILSLVFFFAYRANQQRRKINEMELEIKDSKLDELMTNQETKALSAILKGQEEERERIAQELHDRLGGTLAALKLSLRKPGNLVADEDMEIVNEAVKEVRSISHNLSTGLIQRYGFNQALKQLFKRMQGSDEMKYDLYLHPQISKLGQATGIELYRIVQELLSNTIKHAKASFVSVQTNFDEKSFNLIYEDDGVGFDMKHASKGIGLENIKKRVKRLKGNLNIDSAPGRGTIVIIELNQNS